MTKQNCLVDEKGHQFPTVSTNQNQSIIFNNKEGQRRGRLLVLNFKRISPNLFRFQVRDLVYRDHFVCQKEENMTAMVPGDLVDFKTLNVSRFLRSRDLLFSSAQSGLLHAGRRLLGITFLMQFHSHLATSLSASL